MSEFMVFGKPSDSDGDGIANAADSCPDTKAATANGCVDARIADS